MASSGIRKIPVGITSIVIMGFIITACFSPWMEQEAIITINLSGGNVYSVVNPSADAILTKINHIITPTTMPWPPQEHGILGNLEVIYTLTGPGPTQTFTQKGVGTVTATVVIGYWTVKVEAYLEGVETLHSPNKERIHYATGTYSLEAISGQNTSVTIIMYSAFCDGCSEWVITIPTCLTPGFATRTCTINPSHNETRAGDPALGHDYDYDPSATLPTCVTQGSGFRSCKRGGCNLEENTTYSALGHIISSWVVTNPIYPAISTGTCTRAGCVTPPTRITQVGDTGPGEGIIFYIRPAGFPVTYDGSTSTAHYLEAARNNIGIYAWASSGFINTNITGTETGIGTGRENTRLILATDTAAPAALATRSGYNAGGSLTDWFLPSREELNLLYENRAVIGGFGTGWYWSSSQYFSFIAWALDFIDGLQNPNSNKAVSANVRAVRAF
jgi:hypothetical protein